jgi:hypothetical protein
LSRGRWKRWKLALKTKVALVCILFSIFRRHDLFSLRFFVYFLGGSRPFWNGRRTPWSRRLTTDRRRATMKRSAIPDQQSSSLENTDTLCFSFFRVGFFLRAVRISITILSRRGGGFFLKGQLRSVFNNDRGRLFCNCATYAKRESKKKDSQRNSRAEGKRGAILTAPLRQVRRGNETDAPILLNLPPILV